MFKDKLGKIVDDSFGMFLEEKNNVIYKNLRTMVVHNTSCLLADELPKYKELKELFEWLISDLFEGLGDIDGCDLQDKLESLGLLVSVKIPEEKQKDYEACAEYETDTLLFPWYSKEVKALKKLKTKLGIEKGGE